MPHPPRARPGRRLNTTLDAALLARLDLLLWSEVEQRIPNGAYQAFLEPLIREALESCTVALDGLIEGGGLVRGSPSTINALLRRLET